MSSLDDVAASLLVLLLQAAIAVAFLPPALIARFLLARLARVEGDARARQVAVGIAGGSVFPVAIWLGYEAWTPVPDVGVQRVFVVLGLIGLLGLVIASTSLLESPTAAVVGPEPWSARRVRGSSSGSRPRMVLRRARSSRRALAR